MIQQLLEYVASRYRDIPMTVYEGMLSVLCLGVVVLLAFYGLKRGLRKIVGVLLIEYVFLLFCSTVVFRATADVRKYDWELFWSYKAIEEGRIELLPENIMNVVVFVPLGILLGLMVQDSRFTINKVLLAALIGCGISISIEAMQYFFHKGFAETDDVMHNTLGCLLGYGIYKLVQVTWFRIHGQKIAERSM